MHIYRVLGVLVYQSRDEVICIADVHCALTFLSRSFNTKGNKIYLRIILIVSRWFRKCRPFLTWRNFYFLMTFYVITFASAIVFLLRVFPIRFIFFALVFDRSLYSGNDMMGRRFEIFGSWERVDWRVYWGTESQSMFFMFEAESKVDLESGAVRSRCIDALNPR